MAAPITADAILDALIALSDDRIWATELSLFSGDRRVDFWTLEPVASKGFRASSYEIKISRADFFRDNDEKQHGALNWSDRFWYVTPPALLRKDEVPTWSGLQEWDGEAFRIVKRAPMRSKQEPSWEFVASLMRNSGEARRDTGLLKAQLAYFTQATERDRRQRDIAHKHTWSRFIKKNIPSDHPTPRGGE